MKTLSRLLLLATVMASCVGCDQVTKAIAGRELSGRAPVSLLGDTVRLSYEQNAGGFLSLGAEMPQPLRATVFVAFASLVLVALVVFAVVGRSLVPTQIVAMGLLAAGGIGNLIDRIAQGSARDFITLRVGPVSTGVFNLADVAIMAGVLGLLWMSARRRKHALEARAAPRP
jgi:signal peptidase II